MEQNKRFNIGNYVSDGKRIGKGAFATVYLGHHKDNPSVRLSPLLSSPSRFAPRQLLTPRVVVVCTRRRITGARRDQGRGRGAAHAVQPEAQATTGLGDQHHEDSAARSHRHPSRSHRGSTPLSLSLCTSSPCASLLVATSVLTFIIGPTSRRHDQRTQGTEYIYLVLEYCVGGDFSDYLRKHKRKRLSEDTARCFLRQLGMLLFGARLSLSLLLLSSAKLPLYSPRSLAYTRSFRSQVSAQQKHHPQVSYCVVM